MCPAFLDLDKDHTVLVAGDDINLSAPSAPPSGANCHAIPGIKACHLILCRQSGKV